MRLATDLCSNLNLKENFGFRLQRNNEIVNYFYVIYNVVELVLSSFCTDVYFYFYDWKVSTGVHFEGKRTEAAILVVPIGTNDFNQKAIAVNLNLIGDFFLYDLPSDIQLPVSLYICNVGAEKVMSKVEVLNNERIDSNSLPYFLILKAKEKYYISKIIK